MGCAGFSFSCPMGSPTCFVIKGLEYVYRSAPLMQRISGKIANCWIQVPLIIYDEYLFKETGRVVLVRGLSLHIFF